MRASTPGNTPAAVDAREIDRELHAANLNRTVSLIGTNLAMFTFVLVFLLPRYASNELNGVLFQVTLTASLLAISLFVVSGVSFFEEIAFPALGAERKEALARRGDSSFVAGLMMSTAMPALILFTLPGLLVVAVIAAALWTLSAGVIVRQGRKLLHCRTDSPPAGAGGPPRGAVAGPVSAPVLK
jgi:hypothetical protein